MTIHPSLRGVDTLRGERSVLTRYERIQKLTKDGMLDLEHGSALGLPKVRTKFKVASGKKKKELAAGADADAEKSEEDSE
jgi:small basic protein (TIGR04137 family)